MRHCMFLYRHVVFWPFRGDIIDWKCQTLCHGKTCPIYVKSNKTRIRRLQWVRLC